MAPKVTLSIDFGYRNIGVALVRNEDGINTPLFAGTLLYDPIQLSTKVEPRAQLRRARRTRKTKRNRLSLLTRQLLARGTPQEMVRDLITFCRRRGYSSLFEQPREIQEKKVDKEEETLFRFSREEFFEALEKNIERLLPNEKARATVLSVCEGVLNRAGLPSNEIRPIRIDNRGSSRCAWDGCSSVPPRRDNALRDPLSQFVHTVYASVLKEDKTLLENVSKMLDRVSELGKRLRHASGPDPKKEQKVLRKAISEELRLLKQLSGFATESFEEERTTWSWIRRGIINLIEQTGGRNRFCHQHSTEYVAHLLDGKPIPFKATLTERDIVSRREEILFQKLWRYIEARVLPLATEGIDHVVVERTAIDLLAGSRKQRQDLMNKNALEEMYQHGPRYGFKDDLEMLRAEFDGLCVYCGKPSAELIERDHLLPQSKFFFDSYLNLVPSCPICNRTMKQAASPSEAALKIHEAAYEAYSNYLSTQFKNKPPHLFHTIKKGILNLMQDPERTWEVERYLNLIANQFAQVVGTQRGPRPLARYLSFKIKQRSGRIPEVRFVNGRHTALWRKAAYPEFDKLREKVEGGVVNHALDAMIMACDLPNLTALEGRDLNPGRLQWWVERVRKAAPSPGKNGIPEIPLPHTAPGFEEVLPGNFVHADLARMNWNRKDSGVQRQEIYGWSGKEHLPVKRVTAASIAEELRGADKKESLEKKKAEVWKIVKGVVHPRLKKALTDASMGDTPGAKAAEALKTWLQKSIRGNLDKSGFTPHPADQMRAKTLRDFVAGQTAAIPAFIGIKIYYPWLKANIDLNRVDPRNGEVLHRYVADPANVAKIVAYKKKDSQVNRNKPLTLDWRQSGAVMPNVKALGEVPEGLLNGRALGRKAIDQGAWRTSLHQFFEKAGIVEYAVVPQGCVLKYENGTEQYIRNFSTNYGFKNSQLKGIM
jgi:hypothetical protein